MAGNWKDGAAEVSKPVGADVPGQTKDKTARDSPRTPVEKALAHFWAEVLETAVLRIHDNFFELGGDSIMAVQIVSRVRETLQVGLTLREFFENPTIAGMTRALETAPPLQTPGFPAAPLQQAGSGSLFPLSLEQEGIWFTQQLHPDSTAFNVIDSARMAGPLNADAFRQALKAVVDRQAILRTTFPFVQGRPVQQIAPESRPEFHIVEIDGDDKRERERRALEQANLAAQRPFDLVRGPLWRLILYRVAPNEHIFLLTIHHIISDDWSLTLFMQEVAEHYNAFLEGTSPALPPLPIQYADFAAWQQRWLKSQEAERQRSYWKQQLEGAPILELPTDAPRPRLLTYHGTFQSRPLRKELLARLKSLSNREGVTPFVTLLAVFDVLLSRYTSQDDIPVGVPMTNRDHGAVERLIGTFVNTHVIRADLGGNPTFHELLLRLRKAVFEAYDNKAIPFTDIVAEINPDRDPSRAPLYQVMFNFIAGPLASVRPSGIKFRYLEVDTGGAQVDLTLTVIVNSAAELVALGYNSNLFRPESISRLLDHYEILLEGIIENPDKPISVLPMLTQAERRQVLVEWNATAARYPEDRRIHELFEAQVERTPEAPALLCHDHARMTFRELNCRANRLAHHLRRLGIGSETAVAVLLDRSPEMVVSLLAILKSGGACVPLDPSYPAERWRFILEDARVPVLISLEHLRPQLSGYSGKIVCLDTLQADLAEESNQNIGTSGGPDSPAFVQYTSGSTGTPKGVLALHRGTVNRLNWMWQAYPFEPGEICCANTALVFVDSVREILGPLLQGIPIVLIPEEVVLDPFQFVEVLSAHRVTRLVIVPALLSALLDTHDDLQAKLPALRYCFVSGEALTPALARAFSTSLPQSVLINLYGCSEASGDSTYFEVPKSWSQPYIPIGRTIDNHLIFILDSFLQPVPIGVPGEIFIGGAGLARGYLNRPDMDAEKFIPNPFGNPGERLYRTGDLGCYLKDGNIRYLGRRDRQIKLRGIRIELDEIEAVLRSHPAVREAAVIAWDRVPGVTLLAAYLVPMDSHSPDLGAIKSYLRERLPEHLVPATLVRLDAMPLLPNGKVNRRALPIRELTHTDSESASPAPRTALEKALSTIWRRVLGIEKVGVSDNFFELGGHSLLAAQLLTEIQKELGRRLPLVAIFQAPTIEQMAQALEEPHRITARSTLVPIQPTGDKSPFFCVHGVGGGVWGYERLAELMGPDRPFYGFQARGIDGVEEPDTLIEGMAARYIKALRMIQPEGPVYLGGYSYGGYVAYEMAQQLRAQGRDIAILAMLDTPAPYSNYKRLRWTPHSLARFIKNFPRWLCDFIRLEPAQMIGRVKRQLRLVISLLRPSGAPAQSLEIDLGAFFDDAGRIPPEIRRLMEVELAAFHQFRVRPYPGRVILFRAHAQPLFCSHDPTMGWEALAQDGVDVLPCPGSHHTLLREPYVRGLAAQLRGYLEKTDAAMRITSNTTIRG